MKSWVIVLLISCEICCKDALKLISAALNCSRDLFLNSMSSFLKADSSFTNETICFCTETCLVHLASRLSSSDSNKSCLLLFILFFIRASFKQNQLLGKILVWGPSQYTEKIAPLL